MSSSTSGLLEQSNALQGDTRTTTSNRRNREERKETGPYVLLNVTQNPVTAQTFSKIPYKKKNDRVLPLTKDSLSDNVGRLSTVQNQPLEIALSRPKSLPGMLQMAACHCAACCSCSPNQQKCFVPTSGLSRTVQSLSAGLDTGVEFGDSIVTPGSTDSELLRFGPKLQCNNIDKKRLNEDDESSRHVVSNEHSLPCIHDKFKEIPGYPCSDTSQSAALEIKPVTAITSSRETRDTAQTSRNSRLVSHICPCSELHNCKDAFCQYCQCAKFSIGSDMQPANSARSLLDFKQKLQFMRNWFKDFEDGQKNLTLQALLEESNASQKHLLATKLELYSHDECQPNCRDHIGWLPDTVSWIIFSYLDPVSLCRASCVSQRWFQIAGDPSLWRHLSLLMKWRMSQAGEQKQLLRFKLSDGNINWKELFAERFRLQNNWVKGRCNVRTFEGHTQGVSCVQFDENRIVSGSSDKTIKLWNIRTNSQWAVQTLVGHSGTVRCLHLDGNRLVSGSTDRTIKVWDLSYQDSWASIACKVTMVGHIDTVRCLKVDADKVISGSYDKTLKVWDIKTGICRRTLSGHEAAVLCVQFDSTKIISGSCDKTIKVWTFEGECIMTLQGHQDAVTCLQFDERRIISGSLDCTLRFWNVLDGCLISTIDWKASEGHTRVVRCLQADSWRVVSASDDKTIKVWSIETGQRLVTLRNHTDGVTCLQFNDSVLVSGSYDKTVKLWDFSCC